ncbi:unnamed protein product [Jaminaea pallidilutea]
MPIADAEELGLMDPPLPHLRVRDEYNNLLYTSEGDVGGDEDHDDHCDNYSDDDGDQEHHHHNDSSNSIEDDEDFADDGDEDENASDVSMETSSNIVLMDAPVATGLAPPPYTAIETPTALVPSMGRCLQQKYGTGRIMLIMIAHLMLHSLSWSSYSKLIAMQSWLQPFVVINIEHSNKHVERQPQSYSTVVTSTSSIPTYSITPSKCSPGCSTIDRLEAASCPKANDQYWTWVTRGHISRGTLYQCIQASSNQKYTPRLHFSFSLEFTSLHFDTRGRGCPTLPSPPTSSSATDEALARLGQDRAADIQLYLALTTRVGEAANELSQAQTRLAQAQARLALVSASLTSPLEQRHVALGHAAPAQLANSPPTAGSPPNPSWYPPSLNSAS